MTDAERQGRRRKRLKREKRAAEKELARQKNLDRYRKQAEAKWTQGIILPPETVDEWAQKSTVVRTSLHVTNE